MLVRWVLFVISSLIGGVILMWASLFVKVGYDWSEEATVGVITKRGLPIPFATNAPGYAWTQFNGSAAIADYLMFVSLILLILLFLRRAIKPSTIRQEF